MYNKTYAQTLEERIYEHWRHCEADEMAAPEDDEELAREADLHQLRKLIYLYPIESLDFIKHLEVTPSSRII